MLSLNTNKEVSKEEATKPIVRMYGEMLVPHMRSLFKTVKRLGKMTYMLRTCGISKPGRLLKINSPVKCAMKEGILDA